MKNKVFKKVLEETDRSTWFNRLSIWLKLRLYVLFVKITK